jgi:hypothetical protein
VRDLTKKENRGAEMLVNIQAYFEHCRDNRQFYLNMKIVLTDIWNVCSIMSSTARSDPCATKYSMTANAWYQNDLTNYRL